MFKLVGNKRLPAPVPCLICGVPTTHAEVRQVLRTGQAMEIAYCPPHDGRQVQAAYMLSVAPEPLVVARQEGHLPEEYGTWETRSARCQICQGVASHRNGHRMLVYAFLPLGGAEEDAVAVWACDVHSTEMVRLHALTYAPEGLAL